MPGNQGNVTQGKPLRAAHKIIPVGKATQALSKPRPSLSSTLDFSAPDPCLLLFLITLRSAVACGAGRATACARQVAHCGLLRTSECSLRTLLPSCCSIKYTGSSSLPFRCPGPVEHWYSFVMPLSWWCDRNKC